MFGLMVFVWIWCLSLVVCAFLVWCGCDFVVGWFGFGLVLRCFWLALAGLLCGWIGFLLGGLVFDWMGFGCLIVFAWWFSC